MTLAITAASRLPAWLKLSLRPMRTGSRSCPTIRSVMAPTHGGKIVWARPSATWAATIGAKRGNATTVMHDSATMAEAATSSSRFHGVRSMKPPTGDCARIDTSAGDRNHQADVGRVPCVLGEQVHR